MITPTIAAAPAVAPEQLSSPPAQPVSVVPLSRPVLAQVPIGELGTIDFKAGPPSIRTENGQLVGYINVDVTTSDIAGYVERASQRLREQVQLPAGYYLQWAGQFQYLQAAEKRLLIVLPFTLLIIFVLLYINTQSVTKTFIVLLAVPFSLVGAFWFLYLLGYNLSVAVWVGIIALAGLDAETGVVMLLYLEHAWENRRGARRMNSLADLDAAVLEGAVQRIRPKVMTICAILFGLLPIMWSPVTQAGADVMKRIAAPMIGGVITSGILELLIYPAIYVIWRKRYLPPAGARPGAVSAPAAPTPIRRRFGLKILLALLLLLVVALGSCYLWKKLATGPPGPLTGTPFATQTIEGLTVKLLGSQGSLRVGENDFGIEFHDTVTDRLVDVGTVRFQLRMEMPGMVMQHNALIQPTGIPGQYRARIQAEDAGDWAATLAYAGPRGSGTVRFTLAVKQ